MKLAVVLFNLGGPDSLEAVSPFLVNLFSDPAIIRLPSIARRPLARFIAWRRLPLARQFYAEMGGRSPILPETERQAAALEAALKKKGYEAKCFIAMRYWHPFVEEAAANVKAFGADNVVLLPLYPQFSTTTTQSSREVWQRCAKALKLSARQNEVCCYPTEQGFVAAIVEGLRQALGRTKPSLSYRVLFSAHGLPKSIVNAGDPYQWQVERTVEAVLAHFGRSELDSMTCYQSRVGRLEWIGPSTESEIHRAGQEGKGLIVVPVAFVSEHSETLVELDITYARLAREAGVPDYLRVPTVRDNDHFITGLAGLVIAALNANKPVSCVPGRLCPSDRVCGQERITRRGKHA